MRHSTQAEKDDYEAMLKRKSTALIASEEFESLKAENAKLRKVLQASVSEYANENCSNCWGGLCDDCGCWISDWEEELRELGIEV